MKICKWALGAAVAAAFSSFAAADESVTAFGTRHAGMGGAGLALPGEAGAAGHINPAMYARVGSKFKFWTGGLGYEVQGTTLNQLRNKLKSVNNGGLTSDSAIDLATTLGDGRKEFGIDATSFGMSLGGFTISVDGNVSVTSIPNTSLSNWVKAGSNVNTLANYSDAQLNAYGYGYYSIDIGFGHEFPIQGKKSGQGKLDVGAQYRIIKSYYDHQVVGAFAGSNGTYSLQANPGLEMAGASKLQGSTTGLDFGLNYEFADTKNHLGFVVKNLVEPKAGFLTTTPTSSGGLLLQNFEPFVRHVNAGYAFDGGKQGMFAIDAIDIGNKSNISSIRYGANFPLSRGFEIRAGYDTRTSSTVGFTAFGINVAFSKQNPFSASLTLPF